MLHLFGTFCIVVKLKKRSNILGKNCKFTAIGIFNANFKKCFKKCFIIANNIRCKNRFREIVEFNFFTLLNINIISSSISVVWEI